MDLCPPFLQLTILLKKHIPEQETGSALKDSSADVAACLHFDFKAAEIPLTKTGFYSCFNSCSSNEQKYQFSSEKGCTSSQVT